MKKIPTFYAEVNGMAADEDRVHRGGPDGLDLMARLAGMTLRERWADWHRAPYTSDSTGHISVWQRDR